jgi:hypothetical protein
MGLLDEFEDAQRRQKPNGIQSWYDRMTPEMTVEQREALDEALRSPRFTARAIAEVLRSWGFQVKNEQVGRYRVRMARG